MSPSSFRQSGHLVTHSSSYRIRATFLSLQIPPGVPHALFFSWRSDSATSISPAFFPNREIYDNFQEDLDFLGYIKGESNFQVRIHVKPLFEEPFVLAIGDISVPDDIFVGFLHVFSFPVETPNGQFIGNLSFAVLPERSELDPVRERELMKPNFYDLTEPPKFWGSNGLLQELETLWHGQADPSALKRLSSCDALLQNVGRRSQLYAAFFRPITRFLIRSIHQCWSRDMKVFDFDQTRDGHGQYLPVFGIVLAQDLNLLLSELHASDVVCGGYLWADGWSARESQRE
jgi:hypothetical protein